MIYFAEIQPRVSRNLADVDQLLLRPAIGVQATPDLQLYLGYAHVEEPAAKQNEERLFQQATLFVRDVPGELQSRTRLEQRWRTDGRDTGWRLRQMLRYEYPVAQEDRADSLDRGFPRARTGPTGDRAKGSTSCAPSSASSSGLRAGRRSRRGI
ncbi:DUF2490 domain-containing protein [Sphingomonas sp. MMS24-JH45]